ncbi:MAG: DUF3365 domain-containing protein [Cephaloticoccus sp.]|nr:DUF3365 domain-containing protein [Cephaloticoccus sp.]MCF7761867.1 DUF3365 domain-containing protein [Cephaloticoccus sp.]
MNRRHLSLSLFAVISFLIGSSFAPRAQAAEPTIDFVVATSQEAKAIQRAGEYAINRLARAMTNELRVALSKDKPEDVVPICHLKDLVKEGDTIKGLPRITAFKLTSLKVRSQANEPDAADQKALDAIEYALNSGDNVPNVLVQRIMSPDTPTEWRIYRPLGVATQCLVCHGDTADQTPELRAKLESFYPADQAVNYRDHEWRGLIRVSVADAETK